MVVWNAVFPRREAASSVPGGLFLKDGQQIVKCFAGDDPAVEESDDVAGDAGGDERSFAYALDALAEEEGEDCGQGD